MEPITKFQGETRWLSNFEHVDVTMPDGITYPTTEHAFQAQKTHDMEERKRIARLLTPRKAKNAGREVDLREDWENVKIDIMTQVTRLKFRRPDLRQKLLGTGDAELIESNTWEDKIWGVCNGVGENHLGKILMKIRDELIRDELQRGAR